MPLKRSQRMLVVLQMAVRAEEAAAQQLEQSRSQLAQAEQQLKQVEEYQQGYIQALNQPQQGVSAYSMINDRLFLQQLSVVCDSQAAQIRQLHQNEENCLRNWQQCYQRRRNIDQLIDKLKQGENALLEKQLQKELDELSSVFLARSRH
jgi:flagellar export protein FliJ